MLPQIELRPLDSLTAYARNARTHSPGQIAQLKGSLLEFGWTNAVLADTEGIVAGHGRVTAAGELYRDGQTIRFPSGAEIPLGMVPVVDCSGWSPAQRRAYILADNQLALMAGWDEDLLRGELGDLQSLGFDLGVAGFDGDTLAGLLGSVDAEPGADPEAVPELPTEPMSRLGDVWDVAGHRIMCGSALDPRAWDTLLAGEQIDLVFTDPPYGVSIGDKNDMLARVQGRKNRTGGILNDELRGDGMYRFLLPAFQCLFERMKPGAPIYVYHSDAEGLAFRAAFSDAGFQARGCLVWRKHAFVLGRSDYQPIHELALYSWKPGAAHRWYGGRKQSTVMDLGEGGPFWRLDDGRWGVVCGDFVLVVPGDAVVDELPGTIVSEPRPTRSDLHPTCKPVALVRRHLRNSAQAGDLVADAFGGAGSTAVAAHELGMRARVMELDPRYVDVIVQRLEMFTGQRAVHAKTGALFPEIAA